jgi:hypothetical protein
MSANAILVAVVSGCRKHTSQQHPCTSSRTRDPICRPCSISCPASIEGHAELAAQQHASSCRMVVGCPRMSSGAPWRRRHGESCAGSYHGRCARTSWRVGGNAMDLEWEYQVLRLVVCGSFRWVACLLWIVVGCARCAGWLGLTTTGCVETSLLAEESRVVNYEAASC